MSCMCGDHYCWSCGPAQGNSKCPNCGNWTADGGCTDPETCAAANRTAADAEVQDLTDTEALIFADLDNNPENWRTYNPRTVAAWRKRNTEAAQ